MTTTEQFAAEYMRVACLEAAAHVLDQLAESFGSHNAAIAEFPFLEGYRQNMPADALQALESHCAQPPPLARLRDALRLDHNELLLYVAIGLIEEDARFGSIFDVMQGSAGLRRPTLGLLAGWWRNCSSSDPRPTLRRWLADGLVQTVNSESPRLEWGLQVPGPIWDAASGAADAQLAPGLRYVSPDEAPLLEDLVLDGATRESVRRLPGLLRSGDVRVVVVRGPHHNGRHALLRSLAREVELGSLELAHPLVGDERWRLLGPLATLHGAMPIVVVDVPPGEVFELPSLAAYTGAVGVVAGRQGGVQSKDVDATLALELPIPDAEGRRCHWETTLGAWPWTARVQAQRARMTSGNMRRVARLAEMHASLHRHSAVATEDVRDAARMLNSHVLDLVARRIETEADWSQVAVAEDTRRELDALERRCRARERLTEHVGAALGSQLNCGVRALFTGPTGTGKTLAARALAGSLGMDLYRLDLSTVVNKYIGETEKNLEQAFSRAEELDVILLLDEGDALLTSRTSVQTSNDRYANLETNFLLQRLESFEGILIATTNASEHIDRAFQRRMDVVVSFQAPAPAERWLIWQLHLPPLHAIDLAFLEEVARRCELRGGQIRNAVLHAALLALDDGILITSAHLEAAVQREYRKMSAACPLRAQVSSRPSR